MDDRNREGGHREGGEEGLASVIAALSEGRRVVTCCGVFAVLLRSKIQEVSR